jgi:chromosome segregation ATPase
MTYDHDALRQELQEAQLRISELSTALERLREQRDHFMGALEERFTELNTLKALVAQQATTIERLQLHIQQGVEL